MTKCQKLLQIFIQKVKIFYKKYYIYTKTLGNQGASMKTTATQAIGYIYGIILRVFNNSLTVEEALQLIRDALA